MWMPQDFTDDKSTVVQAMAWCRQATCLYLSQYYVDLCYMVSLRYDELIVVIII